MSGKTVNIYGSKLAHDQRTGIFDIFIRDRAAVCSDKFIGNGSLSVFLCSFFIQLRRAGLEPARHMTQEPHLAQDDNSLRRAGLEPARHMTQEPKSCLSANSNTGAQHHRLELYIIPTSLSTSPHKPNIAFALSVISFNFS